jgi:WD40 repeat protein
MDSPKRYSGGCALPTIPDPKPVPVSASATWAWDSETEGFNPGEKLPAGAIALLGTTKFYRSTGYTACTRLSPDGKLLAAGFESGQYVIFETRTGEIVKDSPRGAEVRSLAFSPSCDKLVVGRDDGTIDILDLATGEVERITDTAYDSMRTLAGRATAAVL